MLAIAKLVNWKRHYAISVALARLPLHTKNNTESLRGIAPLLVANLPSDSDTGCFSSRRLSSRQSLGCWTVQAYARRLVTQRFERRPSCGTEPFGL